MSSNNIIRTEIRDLSLGPVNIPVDIPMINRAISSTGLTSRDALKISAIGTFAIGIALITYGFVCFNKQDDEKRQYIQINNLEIHADNLDRLNRKIQDSLSNAETGLLCLGFASAMYAARTYIFN